MAAAEDAVEIVEGPLGGDLVGRKDARRGAEAVLHRCIVAQDFGESGGVGEVEIAKGMKEDIGGGLILHIGFEVVDELGAEAADEDVHFRAELLADAGVGVRGRGELVFGVAFDDEHAALKGGIAGEPEGGGRADHRAADDHDVIALVSRGWVHRSASAISDGVRP